MKLIIDIDEKEYNECLERNEWDTLSLGVKLIRAVQSGILLPKGHGRLIDADALYDQFAYADYDFDKTLEYAPTIIEADKAESEELGNDILLSEELKTIKAETIIDELEKIKAEIEYCRKRHNCGVLECLDIIDKEIKGARQSRYR